MGHVVTVVYVVKVSALQLVNNRDSIQETMHLPMRTIPARVEILGSSQPQEGQQSECEKHSVRKMIIQADFRRM